MATITGSIVGATVTSDPDPGTSSLLILVKIDCGAESPTTVSGNAASMTAPQTAAGLIGQAVEATINTGTISAITVTIA